MNLFPASADVESDAQSAVESAYIAWLCIEFETKNVIITFILLIHDPQLLKSRQRTLEETAAIFDGEEAMTQIHDKAAAYAGLTHYVSAQEKDMKSDFKMQSLSNLFPSLSHIRGGL
ncbi:hypothetical protein EV702DRAFT_1048889 [Suillus placidus]|uniref:Uncharacterized protein n=1 Tax=Suillus placidus TaxID=48579 RepID=A0A9P7CXY0_9AGAM|nr:hypothetical protein EV702DRAFT_1048889 [Suillus placidus]